MLNEESDPCIIFPQTDFVETLETQHRRSPGHRSLHCGHQSSSSDHLELTEVLSCKQSLQVFLWTTQEGTFNKSSSSLINFSTLWPAHLQ